MNRQEITSNFITSLEQERIRLQLTQAQMAKKLGLSTSGYKKIISGGTTKIDLYTGYMLYILTGKPIFALCGDSNQNTDMVRRFQQLNPGQQRFVDGLISFELELKHKQSNGEDLITLVIPVGNLEDGMIWDSADFSTFNVAPYRQKYGDLIDCAIQITSNHLTPVYHSGDILLVSRKAPRNGDTGVFIHKETGRAYLRKFLQTSPCRLEPINHLGHTFYVDDKDPKAMTEWIKFGYVVTHAR